MGQIERAYQLRLERSDDHETTTSHSDESSNDDERRRLLRYAYDILKDDATRLPYHKFGLRPDQEGISSAATTLLVLWNEKNKVMNGNLIMSATKIDPNQQRLLRWMGYPSEKLMMFDDNNDDDDVWLTDSTKEDHCSMMDWSPEQRLDYLVRHMVERIRPVVEGTMSSSTLANAIASECHSLKKVPPLGASILRCIGRAYRHAAQRAIRQLIVAEANNNHHHHHHGVVQQQQRQQGSIWTEEAKMKFRQIKQALEAAAYEANYKVTKRLIQAKRNHRTNKKRRTTKISSQRRIEYQSRNDDDDDDDDNLFWAFDSEEEDEDHRFVPDNNDDEDDNDESSWNDTNGDSCEVDFFARTLQEAELNKAERLLLGTMEIESVWKMAKIELDRTIQAACERIILSTTDFDSSSSSSSFVPSSPRRKERKGKSRRRRRKRPSRRRRPNDGWVSVSGSEREPNKAIRIEEARLKAATTLELVGNVMVQCSKEGTAWRD